MDFQFGLYPEWSWFRFYSNMANDSNMNIVRLDRIYYYLTSLDVFGLLNVVFS